MRLRGRLFVSYVALTALGMVLLAGYVLASFQRYHVASTEADLAARATALAQHATDLLARGDTEGARTMVARYGAQADLWLRIIGPDGQLVATSSPAADARARDWRAVPGVRAALAGRADHGIVHTPGAADDRLFETRPLVREGRSYGALRASRTLASLHNQVRATQRAVAAALALALAVCALVSARLARGVADPVRRMRDFAVGIGAGRFGARLPVGRRDELGELAAELNTMSERLAALEDERRAFLANASHELRAPVTNVHSTLEVLSDGAADDPALRAAFLKTALEETARMTRLIESLLDLGRLEAGAATLARRPVSAVALARRCADAVRGRFASRGVQLRVHDEAGAADGWIEGDPERLQQALLNVLDNALKFSPGGGAVHVTVRGGGGEGSRVAIEVRDEGAGFSPHDLPHVFEQFYTSERATMRRSGTGLGLSIAQRVVQAHGGTITAANAPHAGGGAVVTFALPRCAAPAPSDAASASAASLAVPAA